MIRRRGRSKNTESSGEFNFEGLEDAALVEDVPSSNSQEGYLKDSAADAKEAGLQHWSAPPAGDVPSAFDNDNAAVSGPSWDRGEDDDDDAWGSDLSEVFSGNEGIEEIPQRSERSRRIVKRSVSKKNTNPKNVSRPGSASRSQESNALKRVPPETKSSAVQQAKQPQRSAAIPPQKRTRAKSRVVSSPDDQEITKVQQEVPRQRIQAPSQMKKKSVAPRTFSKEEDVFSNIQPKKTAQSDISPEPDRSTRDKDFPAGDMLTSPEISSASSGDRDLAKAILVGVVLATVSVAAILFSAESAIILVGLASLAAVYELYKAMNFAGLRPAALLGLVGTVAVPAAAYYRGEASYPLVIGLIVIFGSLWYLVGADTERPVLNLSLTILGIFWIGGLAGFAGLMLYADFEMGSQLLLATIAATAASDIMAYIGGKSYGVNRFHIASPNKTWEGTLTGVFAAFFVGLLLGILPFETIFEGHFDAALVFGAAVGILVPIGDLAESMVKRDLGVKDMGGMLPGHGGILDRVDGLLFALPGAYYTAMLFSLFPV